MYARTSALPTALRLQMHVHVLTVAESRQVQGFAIVVAEVATHVKIRVISGKVYNGVSMCQPCLIHLNAQFFPQLGE